MGNLISLEDNIEDITDIIVTTCKFDEYQTKFIELTPPRELYIDEGELIIETMQETSYSVLKYKFDWFDPNVEESIYMLLDNYYENYSNRSLNRNISDIFKKCEHEDCYVYLFDPMVLCPKHKDETSDSSDETSEETLPLVGSLDDMLNSSRNEIRDCNEWLDYYFYPESKGYEIFKSMGKYMGNKFHSPQIIWHMMLCEALENELSVSPTADPNSLEMEIVAGDMIIGILSKIDDRWWYVGITSECLEKVKNIYNRQIY